MNIYTFYDTDITGREIYDIAGSEYERLMGLCFQYCTSVAMCIYLDANPRCEKVLSALRAFFVREL